MELNLLASFSEVTSYIGNILIALIMLMVMITVHEFGHYTAGKILGFKIKEFSIGFGPALFKKRKKKEEQFAIRMIPLGGYCAFFGEDEEETSPESFNAKKPWKRLIVLVMGAVMNYLFAILVIIVMFCAYGQTGLKVNEIEDKGIYQREYSLQSDDVILSVEGKNIYLITDLMNVLSGKKEGDLVNFNLMRNGKRVSASIILRSNATFNNVEDLTPLYQTLGAVKEGVGQIYTTNVPIGFFESVGKAFEFSVRIAGTVFTVFGELLTGKLGLSAMGGTVTTIGVTASAISVGGLRYLLYMSSFIGVNLAVFNLLPFPALDGSRCVFAIIEWIRKKPINRKVEGIIHTIGLAFLLIFAIVIDLQRCF